MIFTFNRAIKASVLVCLSTCMASAAASTFDIGTDASNQSNWVFNTGGSVFTPGAAGGGTGYSNGLVDARNQDVGGYWTGTLDFNATSATKSATLNIINALADDRMQIFVDGVLIESVGIGSGVGGFTTCNASDTNCTINNNVNFVNNGTSAALTLTNLVLNAGMNTVEVIVNNTFKGIQNANTTDGLVATSIGNNYNSATAPYSYRDATYFSLTGSISTSSTVPEPASIALLLSGLLGLVGTRKKML